RGGVRRQPQPHSREGLAGHARAQRARPRLRPPRRAPLHDLPAAEGEPCVALAGRDARRLWHHGAAMSTANFPPQSRYAATETTVFTAPDGRSIAFLERRFLPDPAVFFVAQLVTITEGDRLD